ncbi:Bug family tripartite tricarboxylate transporter substrate binding protein [Pigmentiphaga litoralis]|uniref:Bug family tripartite tricarboxylate transporter substrate binding protein n=1 Tax=Pigmentiphaga litoralis TaxID=516702 RepID=UPI003B43AEDB
MPLLRLPGALTLILGTCLGFALPLAAHAQDYPNRPIRLVVPFPAGGPTDAYARLIGQKLSETWKQTVVVDNKPGATGLIGSNIVKEAAPDGYTLLFTSNSAQVIGPLLHKPASFDSVADFTPVTMVIRYPMYFLVASALPAKSPREFVALAKHRPGKLNYSSVGLGSGGHLACELINIAAGIDTVHVPYKGAAPAQAALAAGEVDFMCDSVGFSQPMVQAGRMRGLAVTAARRSPAVPDVPTAAEEGVPGVEAYIWTGVFGPKGMSDAIRDKLQAEVARIMALPEFKARADKDGSEVIAGSPASLVQDMTTEKATWSRVIADKNIKAQ